MAKKPKEKAKRIWLNKSPAMTAFAAYNVDGQYGDNYLTIADCNRQITLDFSPGWSGTSPREKVDKLIKFLQNFKKDMGYE